MTRDGDRLFDRKFTMRSHGDASALLGFDRGPSFSDRCPPNPFQGHVKNIKSTEVTLNRLRLDFSGDLSPPRVCG